MKINTVLFDLDGTLLPMDQEVFTREYLSSISKKAGQIGYEPMTMSSALLTGLVAMVRNSGTHTNEDAFWDTFAYIYGEDARKDAALFEEYYKNEYQNLKKICHKQVLAAGLIRELKDMGIRVILATNPTFPRIATESRVRWAGLDPNDFEYISSYENSHYCKPNTEYYREIIGKLGLSPERCLMVGNDVQEDMITTRIGMDAFLVTDCLINPHHENIAQYLHGNFADMAAYVKKRCTQEDESADMRYMNER